MSLSWLNKLKDILSNILEDRGHYSVNMITRRDDKSDIPAPIDCSIAPKQSIVLIGLIINSIFMLGVADSPPSS